MSVILVVGSGLAGLLAAIRATDAGHDVTLVTKGALQESNTSLAQGGIAAALAPDDSVRRHADDTMRVGAGLCDPVAVNILCSDGPARVWDLISLGVDFDRDESGFLRGLEAAHSRPRILHSGGDATGAAITAALIAAVLARLDSPQGRGTLLLQTHTMLADLVTHDGRVRGAVVVGADGQARTQYADTVVLATGGAGSLYEYSTNPEAATGDGVAAAWRAGASVADLEFYQFHPTALAVAGAPLVSEAVRGEGAVLRNSRGERFMRGLHPAAELAPRDVVARGIARAMAEQDGEPVSLDATGLGRAVLERRFPTITRACRDAGLDWARDPVPVAPAAHYWMGGVVTDEWGRTDLPGLVAVGEAARTGAHGANRLASNSLLEAAVFADRAVRALAREDDPGGPRSTPVRPLAPPTPAAARPSSPPAPGTHPGFSRAALQRQMWDAAGVIRSGDALRRAASRFDGWVAPDPSGDAGARFRAIEDANLLDLARLVVTAALARDESRGAHHRSDAPTDRPGTPRSLTWRREPAHRPPSRPAARDSTPPPTRETVTC